MATLGLGALLVATVNVAVDPYGLFEVVEVRGFNDVKPARDGSRTMKSLQLRRQQYDILILGSSRVQLGIDPASPAFGGARVFNLGLVNVHMHEVEGVVNYLLQHQAPHTVMIGVDLISFNANHTVNEDYAESGFHGAALPQLYLPRLLSSRAFLDSVSTIAYNMAGEQQPRFNRHGALERPDDMPYDHRQAFRHMIGYYANWEFYTDFAYSAASVRALRRAVQSLLDRDISVYLFVSPVHASQLEIMHLMGLYEDFERAKRDLVALCGEFNADDRLQLWDFSGYNSVTMERLPAPHQGDRMDWYWEQAHYTSAAGDLMLARMLGKTATTNEIPTDFGVRLGPANIDEHLVQMRRGRLRYHRSNQDAQAIIADIVADEH